MRPVVHPHAVIPAWDDLTPDQRFRYAGNTDPWAGPTDPVAVQRAEDRAAAAQFRNEDPCGCWALDCAECGPRRAGGERPPAGHVHAWALRQDAHLQRAKERAHG